MNIRSKDIPPLWLRPGQYATGDGTPTPDSPEVREALREARRGPALRRPETEGEMAQALEDYLIHPLFFDGTAAELAVEYLREMHRLDAEKVPLVWLKLATVARERLGLPGPPPVPVLTGEGRA